MKGLNIGIKGIGSISPLGNHSMAVSSYQDDNHCFSEVHDALGATLPTSIKTKIDTIRSSDKRFKYLDKSTILAMVAAKDALAQTDWNAESFGVAMGTSRGAAESLEKSHQTYLTEQQCATTTSPLTTMGNLSYWAGEYTRSNAVNLSHSVTCSSSFHALLNAISWIEAGWQERFLVGGAEAPLTAFFIEQMKALRIYASKDEVAYPNQSLNFSKKSNTMLLGEGASCLAIEKSKPGESYLGRIIGMGVGTEPIVHHTSITERGDNIYKAMQMATAEVDLSSIDVVVMHAPGTILGDKSEANAVEDLFGKNAPYMTSNKWKIGHTLGASGVLSIEMALIMLEQQSIISPPFVSSPPQIKPQRILVNAMGFGGNAVSVLLEK